MLADFSPMGCTCWLISLLMVYMLADFFSMGCVLADFSITCWSKHESRPRSNNLPSARPMWGESNSGAVGGILIDFQFNFEHYIVAHKAGYWSISISHFNTTGYIDRFLFQLSILWSNTQEYRCWCWSEIQQ